MRLCGSTTGPLVVACVGERMSVVIVVVVVAGDVVVVADLRAVPARRGAQRTPRNLGPALAVFPIAAALLVSGHDRTIAKDMRDRMTSRWLRGTTEAMKAPSGETEFRREARYSRRDVSWVV